MKCSIFVLAAIVLATGCGDGVGSEEDAERAYLGLDRSIDKAMQLGFDGFNAATSANISPQTAAGDKSGTITISGMVDQGASSNKTMSLTDKLSNYSDDGEITYDTKSSLPVIDLKLSMIPNGTVTGTFVGTFDMTGDLEGAVDLSLTIDGDLQPVASDPAKVERKPGSTRITGTASSDYGDYSVNITR
jgi:hypothetical protein